MHDVPHACDMRDVFARTRLMRETHLAESTCQCALPEAVQSNMLFGNWFVCLLFAAFLLYLLVC
jgi:hypothetical protein